MSVLPRLLRYSRLAAHRAGLVSAGLDRLKADIEALIDSRAPQLMAAHHIPGLAILVTLADGSTITRNLGVADAAAAAPLQPDAVFQVMSIAKPVTAFGVLRLAERGVLDLHAPVSRSLRSWTLPQERRHGFDFEKVTLHRILSHTAGLNVHGSLWAPTGEPAPTPAQLLDGIEGPDYVLRLVHEPGTRLHYSGGGYTLIQLIIEDVTGRPFADVMHDEVLAPLGMSRSAYAPTPLVCEHLVTRHDEHARPLPRALCAARAPTGLYSSARDLARFWGSCFPGPDGEPPGRGVISPDTARAMTTPHSEREGSKACGLGFFLWLRRTDTVFGHSGYKEGWWSNVDGLLQRRCVVCVLGNGAREECVKTLSAEIRQLLLDRAL